jgi:ureidoglycolate hydrolase
LPLKKARFIIYGSVLSKRLFSNYAALTGTAQKLLDLLLMKNVLF